MAYMYHSWVFTQVSSSQPITEILALENTNEWLVNKIHSLYSQEEFLKNTTPGVRSIPRFKDLSIFGVQYFKP